MNQKGFSQLILLVIVGIVVVGAGGGIWYYKQSARQNMSTPQTVTANRLDIGVGNQGEFGDLRIGLGSIRTSDYVDDKGVTQYGNVAGLWIYIRNNSAQNRTLDVYAGQSFTVSKYNVSVDQIAEKSIRLLIWELDAEIVQKLETLRENTLSPLNEKMAMQRICANAFAKGRSLITLWTDNQRTVLELIPDLSVISDGSDTYFNGEGEEVLTIPNRPVEINDPEAAIWNIEVTSLLKDLNKTKTLFCPGM